MNVSTIGFPFASPAGTPALGGAEQGFALALGAISGSAVPAFPGTAPAMPAGATKAPMLPADANAAPADAATLVRAQPTSAITLAQLLATGSTLAPADTADVKVRPDQTAATAVPATAVTDVSVEIAADLAVPASAEAPTQSLAKPVPKDGKTAPVPRDGAALDPKAASAADPLLALAPESAPQPAIAPPLAQGATVAAPAPAPNTDPVEAAAIVKADPKPQLACATAEGEQPLLADLPVATRPARGAAPASTPVKTRKVAAAEMPTPGDQPATQSLAAPVAAVAAVAAPIVQPATVSPAPERKADTGRAGTKPVVGVPTQADAPMTDGADPMAAKLAGLSDEKPGNASLADTGLPAEMAKPEGKAAAPAAPQSFAAQVNQAAAPATAQNALPASAAASTPVADPMISARAGQLGHALGVEIARKVDAGEDTLRVRLNPVELGRVEVTLAFDDRGNLRATMRAESQHALDLLRQDAPDLGRALDSAGIRADSQSFRFESRSDGNGSSSMGGQSGQHQPRGNGRHAFNDEPETATPAYRAIRNDGQVDLLA
jgi:flagellar hook-length control protein FliK